jgi:predicted Zn-ribbon and HTH transcriptional regulator
MKLNIPDDYGHLSGGKKEILTSSECPKCKSKEIFYDF